MFLARKPQQHAIDEFLQASRELPLSYIPAGLARSGRRGFASDELHMRIGTGEAAYRRAVRALREWRQFDVGWTTVFPRAAPTSPGTVVAVLIRHLGFYSLNGAQVVYTIGDDHDREFGYAYGTLTNHAERGEESFEVRFDAHTGAVTYHLRAVSRPRAWLAVAGYPVTRALQARFRMHSARAMMKAVRATTSH